MNKYVSYLLNNKMFKQALERAEQDIYNAALLHTIHNESAAARLLGVSRGTLRSRLKKWGNVE